MPVGREFPLPLPGSKQQTQRPADLVKGAISAHLGSLKCAVGTACTDDTSSDGDWVRAHIPATAAIQVSTHVAAVDVSGHALVGSSGLLLTALGTPEAANTGHLLLGQLGYAQAHGAVTAECLDTAIGAVSSSTAQGQPAAGGGAVVMATAGLTPGSASHACSPAAGNTPRDGQHQQQGPPVSSPRAFRDTLDQLVRQKQQQLLSGAVAPQCTSNTATSNLQASAVIRGATQQMAAASSVAADSCGTGQSPFLGPARGGWCVKQWKLGAPHHAVVLVVHTHAAACNGCTRNPIG